jgi:hypothetical protein
VNPTAHTRAARSTVIALGQPRRLLTASISVGKIEGSAVIQHLLAHAGVCVVQALVERGPAHVRHGGALGLRGAFICKVLGGPESAEA